MGPPGRSSTMLMVMLLSSLILMVSLSLRFSYDNPQAKGTLISVPSALRAAVMM